MSRNRKPNDDFKDFVLDQFGPLRYFRCQPMFGGYGLYLQTIFFGIIYDSRLFFRVNDATRPAFDATGSETFRPKPGTEMKGYREVPADIIEDPDKLARFAFDAAEVPTSQRRNLRP
jgi:DNA transformation protein